MRDNRKPRAHQPLPSQDELRALLDYDAATGKLFWKHRSSELFPNEAKAASWNTRYAGKEAFTAFNSDGYKTGCLHNASRKAHRVIWKMVHGYEPEEIDHINRDRADNRLENMRECTHQQNSRNSLKPRGTSRFKGVHTQEGRWVAQISDASGRLKYLGMFADEEDAALAYDRAAVSEHGPFATLNFRAARQALSGSKEQ